MNKETMQTELNNAAKAFGCDTYCVQQLGMSMIRRQDNKRTVAMITHDGHVNRFGRDENYQESDQQ